MVTPEVPIGGDRTTAQLPASTVRAQRRAAGADLDSALWELRRVVELGDGLVDEEALAPARTVLERASQRRALAPGMTVVALLGATGSGKSSLFNALTGTSLARTAVTRPTTTQPLAAVPAGLGAEATRRAGALLDWLEVTQRVQLERDPGTGPATILLDLPDVDSDERAHRIIVERLAGLVDVLVWVLDPEKYADAVVHRDFIAPMSEHADVTLVALNQVDRLAPSSREDVTADLARLLGSEGLARPVIVPVSARTLEGVADLRERIGAVAMTTRAAEARLAADVRTAAEVVARSLGNGDDDGAPAPATGRVLDRAWSDLADSAARAAGVELVTSAVRASSRQRATRAVGWVPVRWIGRVRRDPLRALHLGADVLRGASVSEPGAQAAELPAVARTSLPAASPAAAGALRSSAHALAVLRTAGLPGGPAAELVARADARVDTIGDELDAAVARTDLEADRRPRWWSVAGALQWLLALTALIGGLWLAAILVANRYLLLDWQPPRLGTVPWPSTLLIGGLALGSLAAVIGTALARAGAARSAARARRRLRESTDAVVRIALIEPLDRELVRWRDLAEALSRLR